MGSIVIAMPKPTDATKIADIIKRSDIWDEPLISRTGGETLEFVNSRDISIVICTRKLSDMGYEELSGYLPQAVNMILLTQDASLVPFSSNIVRLLLPFKPSDLINTINMVSGGGVRRAKLKPKPKRSEAEQKIVDDAKAVLINRNGMSEPEAFRYIQKISMDQGRTIVESAQMILLLNDE